MTLALRRAVPFTAALAAFATLAIAAARAPLGAQDIRPTAPYSSTLTYGTGLINIPTAWVSPTSGDLFVTVSARSIGSGSLQPKASGSLWDLTESVEAHLGGRLSAGLSLYSTTKQEVGGFAQLLILKQPDEGPRWMPSFAVGVRNLGSSKYQDRFVTGDQRVTDVVLAANPNAKINPINGSPTLYGVLTRDFQFQENSMSLTAGYGSGLFSNNGGLDTIYNKSGTLAKGFFVGTRFVVPTGASSAMSFIVENDAWDWNAGAELRYGHMSVGLFMLELEEAKGIPSNKPLANYTKAALLLSYNASIPDIARNGSERAQAAENRIQARRLTQEIAQRATRTKELQVELAGAKQGADKAAAAQRAALEKQLDAEREAMKKAADRLEQLQKGKPPTGPDAGSRTPEGK